MFSDLRSMAASSKELNSEVREQSQSTFFSRLPLEIREWIYRYALAGSDHVHIYRHSRRRLGSYSRDGLENHRKPSPELTSACEEKGAGDLEKCTERQEEMHHGLLSMLRTCRKV